jgi:putative transferase (TIGR04331 family)
MRLLLSKPAKNDPNPIKGVIISRSMAPDWSSRDFEKRNLSVPTYHWDDRARLIQDATIIKAVVDELVTQLAVELNDIHGIKESRKYWEIVIGEWCFLFTQVIFDRWRSVTSILKNESEIEIESGSKIPNDSPLDTKEFITSATLSESWNSNLYGEIIHAITGSEELHQYERKNNTIDKINMVSQSPFKSYLKLLVNQLSARKSKFGKDILIQNIYLNNFQLMKFCFKIGQIPYFEVDIPTSCLIQDTKIRNVQIKPSTLKDLVEPELAEVICQLLPKYFPRIYLELFSSHKKKSLEVYQFRRPHLIVTANSYSLNEEWKKWAAYACSNGSKMVIIQHGGMYGANKFSLIQEYELMICDKFLTWGWEDDSSFKIVSSHATKLIGYKSRKRRKFQSRITFIAFEMPLHSYWLASMPVGPQVIDSALSSLEFIKSLNLKLKRLLIVRPYQTDYGLNAHALFGELLPHQQILCGEDETFIQAIAKSRIVVTNYNGTTYIQTMALNVPTVVFWNKDLWEIDLRYTDIFNELNQAGVLFYSVQECAEFLNLNFETIEEWWSSEKVQISVKNFLNIFGNVNSNSLVAFAKQIASI